jgi:signal transduction histidine kinase/ActR/RegA family two-component response regulator
MPTDPDQPTELSRDLLAAIRDLSFARELDAVTSIVRTTARRLTRADGVTFVLKEGGQCYYADEDAIAPLWKGRRFPLDACISGWVMQHGHSVAIPDIYSDSRIPHDAYRLTFVKSLAMVPVRAEDPVAAVGAYWASTHAATAAELRALEAIADAAALALTNVQLWADLRSVNHKLQQRVTEFETLLDVLPVGIGIAYDAQANNIRTNRWFSEFLRLAPESNASLSAPAGERPTHFRLLRDGRALSPEELPLQRAAREGIETKNLELELEFDSGDRRRLLEYATPLFDEAGQVRGSVGAFVDVTDRKRLEEQRERVLRAEREAREEAERANRIKDEFLTSLSHELRTPLNAILGWTQLLRRKADADPFLMQGLETLERNAKLQTQLIDDLLDMSRILSGKIRLDVQAIALGRVIEAAVESVRPSAEAKGLSLTMTLDPEAGPVSGDPSRLQQVVWNLVTNAVKFSSRGGSIAIRLERVNSHLEISISDTGIGISPDFLPHVFERFRQADASTTRRHGGLGIGLSIVKNLVDLHGGTVRAKSAGTGKGATFVVSLPVMTLATPTSDRRQPAATSVVPMDADPPSLEGISVLVIDDDDDSRTLLSLILGNRGATVTTAHAATSALDAVAAATPDVIISDIGLPERDGYQLIREIRAISDELKQVPALALTAFARSEDRRRALLAGFQMHISKPVEPAELCTAVASLAKKFDL